MVVSPSVVCGGGEFGIFWAPIIGEWMTYSNKEEMQKLPLWLSSNKPELYPWGWRFDPWLSGLRTWHCCELQCRSQMRLGSGIAVPVAVASRCSSNSTPSQGTSICHRCSSHPPKRGDAHRVTGMEVKPSLPCRVKHMRRLRERTKAHLPKLKWYAFNTTIHILQGHGNKGYQ